MYFFYFVIHVSKEKVGTLRMNKTWIPLSKDGLSQNVVKIGSVELEKKFFLKFVNVFSLIGNYLPFGKGRDPLFEQLESPPLKNAFCQVRLKLDQWLCRRRKYEKFTDKRKDGRRTTDDQKNSLEL